MVFPIKRIHIARLLIVFLLLCQPPTAWGAFALVAGATLSGGSSDGNDFQSGTIDTTGADLLLACVADYDASAGSLSDSKGNTWTPLTAQDSTSAEAQLYYSVPTSVGINHSWNVACTGCFPTGSVAAFSGSHATPFDQQNGAVTAGATSLSTGSVTPSENNELVVACLSFAATNTISIDNGFSTPIQTDFGSGAHYGGALAYKIQTTAAAVNPAFSWSGSTEAAAAIASFKAAAVAATRRSVGAVIFP